MRKENFKMKRFFAFTAATLAATCVLTAGYSHAAPKRDVRVMSVDIQRKVAQSAAPSSISNDASVMVFGPDGKLTEEVAGTNGFTCIPDLSGQEKPDPFCGNAEATQWVLDLMDGRANPSNSAPGIAFMMQGGWHWVKNGKTTLDKDDPGAKRVKDPPNWKIIWPVTSGSSMLPGKAGGFGSYIMWEGTPYAHIVINQNPKWIR